MTRNPFHASFGVSPPLLVGRDDLLDDFAEALEDGPGAAGRATLYTGARGAGKTVMLNAVEDRARERGWLIVSETATPGFVSRITQQHLPRLLRDFDPKAVQRRMSMQLVGAQVWRVNPGAAEITTEDATQGVARARRPRCRRELRQPVPPTADRSRADPPHPPRLRRLRAALPPRVPPPALSHRRLIGAVRLLAQPADAFNPATAQPLDEPRPTGYRSLSRSRKPYKTPYNSI
jgi:hypothetical protein